jgi:hypothetical protein
MNTNGISPEKAASLKRIYGQNYDRQKHIQKYKLKMKE